ncbi:PAS domain-containing sensor histidine kinase [Mesorhizobium sp. KR9-304]|uniref:sensor histidine kinase n=1 Tax=Mesorhizobium sp. KR9-304 TaxID=3156614 RepID=UPI0032B58C3E
MRLSGTRTGELLDAVAARCERLVRGSVRDPAERLRQRRFIGVMLVAPFLTAAPAAILFPPLIGIQATLAAVGAIFGAAFLIAAAVAVSGRTHVAATAALALGIVALAAIAAAAGGIASPAALALAALPFEAWWTRRTPQAALVGVGSALAALPLQALFASDFAAGAVAGGAHWLIPLGYLAFVVPRFVAWLDEKDDATAARPLEDIIDAVALRLDGAGEVVDASPQARRILGVAPELLLSGGLFERVHVADRVAYLCALADLRENEGYRRVEARVRVPDPDGAIAADYRPFVIEMMRPAIDVAGVTALLRANDETAALRAALAASADGVESSELANSRMLAAVSHELRTPLNSIIGFSDMLLHGMLGGFADPRQKEYVGLVHESGCHLLAVVNSILDVSKIESGAYTADLEPFRFGDAVEMCRSMLQQQAKDKELGLRVDIPPEIGEVHADKRAVKQMLINLVSNAIKFTPAGGTVAIGGKRIGSRLHFWVSDTGIGMSADDLARIGKPFTQVQNDYTRRFEGAGLGLSLVKGLVALHHGTMTIESEPGHGTTVTISLPVDAPPRESAVKTAEIVAMKAGKEDFHGTFRKTA